MNRTRAIRITSAALYLLSYPGKFETTAQVVKERALPVTRNIHAPQNKKPRKIALSGVRHREVDNVTLRYMARFPDGHGRLSEGLQAPNRPHGLPQSNCTVSREASDERGPVDCSTGLCVLC